MPSDAAGESVFDRAAAPPLVELLETKGQVKVLDVFLTRGALWLTESRLAELAGVDQSTVNRNIATLQMANLVENRGSQPTEYRINEDNEFAAPLREFHLALMDHTRELQEVTADDSDAELSEFTDGSAFVALFQDTARVKLIDALLTRGSLWATRERLAELAEVHPTTLDRHLDVLRAVGLVEEKEDAWPQEFRLPTDEALATELREAHLHLLDETQTLSKVENPQEPEFDTMPQKPVEAAETLRGTLNLGSAITLGQSAVAPQLVQELLEHLKDPSVISNPESGASDSESEINDEPARTANNRAEEISTLAAQRFHRSGQQSSTGQAA